MPEPDAPLPPGREDSQGLMLRRCPGADRLLIVFGGLAGGRVNARFEAPHLTHGWPVDVLVVRDVHNSLYHRGIDASHNSIPRVAALLRSWIEELAPKRVVTFGASAGGYGALLFGHLLGADEVHAFSPLVRLSRAGRARMGDVRWALVLDHVRAFGALDSRYADLPELFEREPPRSALHVHYATDEELDTVNAQAMDGQAQLHPDDGGGGHGFVRRLKEDGQLTRRLVGALGFEDTSSTGAKARHRAASPETLDVVILDELGTHGATTAMALLPLGPPRGAVTLVSPTRIPARDAGHLDGVAVHDAHQEYFRIYGSAAAAIAGTEADWILLLRAGVIPTEDGLRRLAGAAGAEVVLPRLSDGERMRPAPPSTLESLLTAPWTPDAVLLGRDIVRQAGGLDPSLGQLGLWELLIRCLKSFESRAVVVEMPEWTFSRKLARATPGDGFGRFLAAEDGVSEEVAAEQPAAWRLWGSQAHSLIAERHQDVFGPEAWKLIALSHRKLIEAQQRASVTIRELTLRVQELEGRS